MSQKVSPGAWWVTSATVIRGVVALPAAAPDWLSSAFLPPELLEQPARVRAAAAAPATTGTTLRERKREERSIFPAPHCATGNVGKGKGSRGSEGPGTWRVPGRSPRKATTALGRDPIP